MIIGVSTEVKDHKSRVGVTPDAAPKDPIDALSYE
jgi:alanine dehydrogenase